MWYVFWQWQRETWRGFWRERAIILPFLISVGLNLAILVIVKQTTAFNEQAFVLRYSIYVGTNLITNLAARWWFVYTAVGLLIINSILGYITARRTLVLKYIWLWGTVFLELIILWLAWLIRAANS